MKKQGDSGTIALYDPAARQVEVGDKVCVISYGLIEDGKAQFRKPQVILLDERNKIKL